jgi:hypothetical protein
MKVQASILYGKVQSGITWETTRIVYLRKNGRDVGIHIECDYIKRTYTIIDNRFDDHCPIGVRRSLPAARNLAMNFAKNKELL